MLTLQRVSYTHPDYTIQFSDLDLTVNRHEKIAVVGNNGCGKSTLLRLIAGELKPASGIVYANTEPYFVPQHFGQFDAATVAEAIGVAPKLRALHEILGGNVTAKNMDLLADDWSVEERCVEAFARWGLDDISPDRLMATLSGGQKTKIFLAGCAIHKPAFILLDEPSNHLDADGRKLLYDFVESTTATIIAVSHDRAFLDRFDTVAELTANGMVRYGGDFNFYLEQKRLESDALHRDLDNREKELRKARETARQAAERQQKLDARGRKKQSKAGMPTIMMNTMRSQAERSTARLKEVHDDKTGALAAAVSSLRESLPELDKMRFDFGESAIPAGKKLVVANGVNFVYHDSPLWRMPVDFELIAGERVAIAGANGTGKSTLLRLLQGDVQPACGVVTRAAFSAVAVDQDYSLIDPRFPVYEQVQRFNDGALQEHEIKVRLNRFLFDRHDWQKSCASLSGGERMRLALCCLTVHKQAPDVLVLDEPTNNLDLQNIAMLTAAITQYRGSVVVVSHDERFLSGIGVTRTYRMPGAGR